MTSSKESTEELHTTINSSNIRKTSGPHKVVKKESESWDEDFLFQHSASDLHLPLSNNSSPKSKRSTPKTSLSFLNSPYGGGHWPNPSNLSLGSDSDNEPTLTQATISSKVKGKLSQASNLARDSTVVVSRNSKQRMSIAGSRTTSHSSSAYSTTSRSPARIHDWRSPTPSLSSDLGGITTSTETELETEGYDDELDLSYCSTTEAETEVEAGPVVSNKQVLDKASRRRSGLRMPSLPSLFKPAKNKGVTKTATKSAIWDNDRDLPSDLRNLHLAPSIPVLNPHRPTHARNASDSTQEVITVVPLHSKGGRSRLEHSTLKQISSPLDAPKTVQQMSSYTASPDRISGTSLSVRNPAASSSTTSFQSDLEDSDHRSSLSSQKPIKRRLKGRSRVPSASSTAQTGAPNLRPGSILMPARSRDSMYGEIVHPVSPTFSVEQPGSPTPRRRPLSFSMFPNRSQTVVPTISPVRPNIPQSHSEATVSRSTSGTGWKKFHRPSSSIGSLPVSFTSSPQTTSQPPNANTGQSFFARARAFSKSRSPPPPLPPLPLIVQQVSKSDSVASALSVMSTASTIRPLRQASQPNPPLSYESPYQSSVAKINEEPITPIKTKLKTTPSPTSSKRALPSLSLPPIQSVTRAGSHEQLTVRTPLRFAPNGQVLPSPFPSPSASLRRPMTAGIATSRPNSYFTIGTLGTGGSPGRESVMDNGSSSPVTRRVSLSDLRIPTRITNAQARIGQDLQRVREFKAGVEELKELRKTYQSLLSSATASLKAFPELIRPEDFDSKSMPDSSPIIQAKVEQSFKKIEQQYMMHWECCDVLIDLADGSEDDKPTSALPPRDRCISMMPIGSSSPARPSSVFPNPADLDNTVGLRSPPSRHMEILQTWLGKLSEESNTQPTSGGVSRVVMDDAPPSKSAYKPEQVKPIFSIRDFLRALRREPTLLRVEAKVNSNSLNVNKLDERRAVSDPLRNSTRTSAPPNEDSDEEEDWDRSSSSSGGSNAATPKRPSICRSRTMSAKTDSVSIVGASFPTNLKLSLTAEAMPALLVYLSEVKERCSACLVELRNMTV